MTKDDDKKPLLATGDKALLEAAATGKGAIAITPDGLRDMLASISERKADIESRYPALVAACPPETRIAVAAWVMKNIVDHARDGGTFRYLIYDRLGFGPEAYVPLYLAGGMDISNEFSLSDPEHRGTVEEKTTDK